MEAPIVDGNPNGGPIELSYAPPFPAEQSLCRPADMVGIEIDDILNATMQVFYTDCLDGWQETPKSGRVVLNPSADSRGVC